MIFITNLRHSLWKTPQGLDTLFYCTLVDAYAPGYGFIFITLCAYVQQGYAFSHIGLCMCAYICICGQKSGYLRSYHLKISHWCNNYTARLSSLTAKKGAYYAWWFVYRKKFEGILLTGWKRVPGKLYYSKPRLIYMQCIMQLALQCYCNCSADLQYCYRYSLYWQCLAHTGYVFCGTLVQDVLKTITKKLGLSVAHLNFIILWTQLVRDNSV